ncbi:hypothetical protein SEA_ZADA_40 [Microbacterium phage Zada]|uniref:Uncharacterized protein n=1 Tax=Microbacterium phage Zada TaxID=2725622 RepID=A0A6M3SVV1_9CAUD|nr:hypothetical protein SEA_ZADA_40 [Microbacterium phage Zada]
MRPHQAGSKRRCVGSLLQVRFLVIHASSTT